MQFNLFAEDPIATISNSPLPWITYFDNHAAVETNGVDGDESGETLITWKNEDWAQLQSIQDRSGKKGNLNEAERSPWAGKNPTAASRVGTKPIRGEFEPGDICVVACADLNSNVVFS